MFANINVEMEIHCEENPWQTLNSFKSHKLILVPAVLVGHVALFMLTAYLSCNVDRTTQLMHLTLGGCCTLFI